LLRDANNASSLQHLPIHLHSLRTSVYVSIRRHTCVYFRRASSYSLILLSIRQHTSAHVSIRQLTSAYTHTYLHSLQTSKLILAHIAQHTSAYVSIRQHTHIHTCIRFRRASSYSLISLSSPNPQISGAAEPTCQYLYFCTSKASKLSTCGARESVFVLWY
jgi:hypothetical protein